MQCLKYAVFNVCKEKSEVWCLIVLTPLFLQVTFLTLNSRFSCWKYFEFSDYVQNLWYVETETFESMNLWINIECCKKKFSHKNDEVLGNILIIKCPISNKVVNLCPIILVFILIYFVWFKRFSLYYQVIKSVVIQIALRP